MSTRFWSLFGALFLIGVLACSGTPVTPAEESEAASGGELEVAEEAPAIVTVPAGTALKVRLVNGISTKNSQNGDTFQALLDGDLTVGEQLVIPDGAPVTGKLLEVKEPGKVKGRASMTLALQEIQLSEERYPVRSESVTFEAQGSKSRDAKVIGGTAGAGALIGAIAGGKKGAAIGAAAGGGAGTAAVLMTAGDQVELAAEQAITFKLKEDLEVALPGS